MIRRAVPSFERSGRSTTRSYPPPGLGSSSKSFTRYDSAAKARSAGASAPVSGPGGVSVTRKRAPDRDSARARNRPRTLFGVADEEIHTSDDPNALLGRMRALSVAVPGVEPGTFGL